MIRFISRKKRLTSFFPAPLKSNLNVVSHKYSISLSTIKYPPSIGYFQYIKIQLDVDRGLGDTNKLLNEQNVLFEFPLVKFEGNLSFSVSIPQKFRKKVALLYSGFTCIITLVKTLSAFT